MPILKPADLIKEFKDTFYQLIRDFYHQNEAVFKINMYICKLGEKDYPEYITR